MGVCKELPGDISGMVQNLTQISSEMSRRAITLLLSCMRWLVIQPVRVCTHTHIFPCGLLIHCICSLAFKPVNALLKSNGQKIDH